MFEAANIIIGRRIFSKGSLVATPWFTLLPLLVLQSQAVHTGWPGGGGGQHGHTPKVRCFRAGGFLYFSLQYSGQHQLGAQTVGSHCITSKMLSRGKKVANNQNETGEHRLCARPVGRHDHPVQWEPQSGRQLQGETLANIQTLSPQFFKVVLEDGQAIFVGGT